MKRTIFLVSLLALLAGPLVAAEKSETPEAANRVTAVTLYRGFAQVTRTVELPARKGEIQLLIRNLPATTSADSLSAMGSNGTVVRMVQFRQKSHYAKQDPTAMAPLKEKLEAIDAKLAALTQRAKLLDSKQKYLDKLESFTTVRLNEKVAKGDLDAKAMQETTTFLFEQREGLVTARIKQAAEGKALQAEKIVVQQKLGVQASPQSASGVKREYQAILHVYKTSEKATTLQLQYLVSNTQWSPSYLARLDEKNATVQLDYTASVYQNSGEAWNDIELTLSTAQPALNCEIPLLTPLRFDVAAALGKKGRARPGTNRDKGFRSNRYASQNVSSQAWNTKPKDTVAFNYEMNQDASLRQLDELLYDKREVQKLQARARKQLEGMAVTYVLPGKRTLVSQGAVQLVPIAQANLKASAYLEATPLISPFVFRGAKIVNTSGSLLLDGEYKAYVGTKFVGRGRMARTANGQSLNLGFGVDTQLLCHRKLVDKTQIISWGKRVQTFQYELSIENFSTTPRAVRVYGRYPMSKNPAITTKLSKPTTPLCKDDTYQKQLLTKGILRWDITVEAGTQGINAKTVDYGYEIKSPEDMPINKVLDIEQPNPSEIDEQRKLRLRH